MSELRALICILTLICTFSCDLLDTPDATINTGVACPASESFFGTQTSFTVGSTNRVAQKFALGGSVSATLYINRITVQMESSNLTSIKMELYRDQSGSHSPHHPEDGTIIATSTVTSGLGSSSTASEVVFNFTRAPLQVNNQYYVVLTPTGGAFDTAVNTSSNLTRSEVYLKSSSWSSLYSSSSGKSLGIKFDYDGCDS